MATRTDELAKTIINLYGKDLEPEYRPERPGDIKDSYANIELAKKVPGYQPKVNLKDGLNEILNSKKHS